MNTYAIACEDSFLSIAPYSGVTKVPEVKATKFGKLQLPKLRSLLPLLPDGSHIVEVSNV